MKVAIVGATSETGTSIVNGLLNSTESRYVRNHCVDPAILTRKPEVLALQDRGVKIVSADLNAPENELVELLRGINTVISAISASGLSAQIPLANAAKVAGVERFLPCCYGTVLPPEGILALRETKEHVINRVKQLRLPYTIVDVGFWYQLMLPRLPSGRIDYALPITLGGIAGDGNTPCAFTDLHDIGKWVARIIADPRTLNKMVFAYNAVLTMNQVCDTLEVASGEKVNRNYISEDVIQAGVERAEAHTPSPASFNYFEVVKYQYFNSMGLHGDNTPEYARYLGYLDATELYPDMEVSTPAAYCEKLLSGKATTIYQRLQSGTE